MGSLPRRKWMMPLDLPQKSSKLRAVPAMLDQGDSVIGTGGVQLQRLLKALRWKGSVVAMKATAIERVLGAADAVGAQVPAAKRLSQGNFSSNVNALLLLGHGKGCAGKASLAAGESLAPHAWRFCTNLRGLLFCC
ncbi:uncharacterized protein MONOS_16979 [Monocercomonoides exilis]|uniref:uncharacterized protein n=1 Tax=Monocercomonoides exilis TaxID=2049356 RepID=UPI00355AAB2A|nr:hypothetical protein MONOS_16979 [Monocercomonoides exilis]